MAQQHRNCDEGIIMPATFRPLTDVKLKYLVSGNPAGGTHFISKFLTKCGLLCGHEQIAYGSEEGQIGTFDLRPPNGPPAEELIADSSYTHTKYANFGILKTLPIIIVLRNPVAIVNSLIWMEIAHNHVVNVSDVIEGVAQRYAALEDTGRVIYRCRIEEPDDLEGLCAHLNLTFRSPDKLERNRHNLGRINISRRDFNYVPNHKLLDEMALTYGYSYA